MTTKRERPGNVRVRNLPTESSSLSRALRFSFTRAITRPNDPTLSRPPATDYYRAHRAERRTRESTSLDFSYRSDSPTVLFSPTLSLSRTRPSREDDGCESSATKPRSFQNGRVSDASVGSLFWPFPLCVSANGNGLPGGDDAGGRASTAHAQPQRPGCAHGLRNDRGGPWDSGAAAAGTAAAEDPLSDYPTILFIEIKL